jgi:hypothetical protein
MPSTIIQALGNIGADTMSRFGASPMALTLTCGSGGRQFEQEATEKAEGKNLDFSPFSPSSSVQILSLPRAALERYAIGTLPKPFLSSKSTTPFRGCASFDPSHLLSNAVTHLFFANRGMLS